MGKWKPLYDNNRKYNKDWEKTYTWLKQASDGTEYAYCKLCRCTVLPKLSNISTHDSSTKHLRNTPTTSNSKPQTQLKVLITSRKVDDKVKVAELKLAASITCHSAIRTIDHLSEILVAHGQGSPLGDIKLHRTKCIALIKNIISPAMKSELIEDLKNKKYALIIDESTDISTQKYLCTLVRFFSEQKNEITTGFIGLIPIQEATGENIFNLINDEIQRCNQSLENCIGFASDGASNMVGCNNSVWTRMREVSPFCVQLKCICHSLALCIKYAVSKLPSNIGFLLVEIPNWFRHSNIRREAYKDLFKVMNSSTTLEETRNVPLPFEKTSNTRWLVRGKVMYNILMNWEELKAYFVSAEIAEMKFETKFKARLIKEMLLDVKNFLYFHFATPIVQEFERVNSLFQKSKADPQELNEELYLHYRSLNSRLYDVNQHKKSIDHVDFGAKFLLECHNFLRQRNNDLQSQQEIVAVKERCLGMLEEALMQVKKRLPSSRTIFQDLAKLSPGIILNQLTRPLFSELPFIHLAEGNLAIIEEQYRKLPFVDWKEEIKGGIPNDSEKFWLGVRQHPHFKELASFALNCLITPVSNAVVESVFSLLTCVKTKSRNRLQLPLLESIIRIRAQFLFSNKCCKDFIPSAEMLESFKAENVYPSAEKPDSSVSLNCEEENLSDDEFFM